MFFLGGWWSEGGGVKASEEILPCIMRVSNGNAILASFQFFFKVPILFLIQYYSGKAETFCMG